MYYYPNTPLQQPGVSYGAPGNFLGGGQIMPIGYSGYNQAPIAYGTNGGYYTGNYQNFNPYYIQQQQEAYRQQVQAEEKFQSNISKKLFQTASSYTGHEVTKADLDSFDRGRSYNTSIPVPEGFEDLTETEQQEYYQVANREQTILNNNATAARLTVIAQHPNFVTPGQQYAAQMSMMYQQNHVSNDVGLIEYLNNPDYGLKAYNQAVANEQAMKHNTSQLYNKEQYGNMLQQQNRNNLFGPSLNPGANIDDQEIRLPSYISEQQRAARRKAFLDSIMRQ